jgi:hypothetical protein
MPDGSQKAHLLLNFPGLLAKVFWEVQRIERLLAKAAGKTGSVNTR